MLYEAIYVPISIPLIPNSPSAYIKYSHFYYHMTKRFGAGCHMNESMHATKGHLWTNTTNTNIHRRPHYIVVLTILHHPTCAEYTIRQGIFEGIFLVNHQNL